LLETLVSIAAVVIVAAGLAAVFDSIGKTVASGRRVSRVNQYGRLLEQQLRQDFQRMTRDGFLVIRQQFADVDGNNEFDPQVDRVPLYEDQERTNTANSKDQWRRRRVDEILFFERGDFKSSRPPMSDLAEWASPSSREAMIYYGHGMRPRPDAVAISNSPRVNETNTLSRNGITATGRHTLGYVGAAPTDKPNRRQNPNVYASEWILLRQQTLLVSPDVTARERRGILGFASGDIVLADKDTQVAGQPAAASIFRSLNRYLLPDIDPSYAALNDHLWYVTGANGNYDSVAGEVPPTAYGPQLSSGIVDIATTSLEEIQRIVYGYAGVGTSAREPAMYDSPGVIPPALGFTQSIGEFGAAWDSPVARPTDPVTNWESLDFMHAWMDNAMPTRAVNHGDGTSSTEGPNANGGLDYDDENRGVRILTDVGAPDLLNVLNGGPALTSPVQRRSDRLMVGASNLVVGCTEFIVDWTLGTVSVNPGDLRWHGPETPCKFYEYDGPTAPSDCNYRLGTLVKYRDSGGALLDGVYPITDRLFYGYNPNSIANLPLSVSSFFGGIDPTFVQRPGLTLGGPETNPTLEFSPTYIDPATGRELINPTPAQRPWRWPRMIRVRVTIADPVDPGIESTFEYVFDVPDEAPR